MLDLAVIILQKNEALHIRRCLGRLRPLEPRQIFVVDCYSTDGSDAMAREDGAEVVYHEWPGTQALQFNWALEHLPLETSWILRLDADEYLVESGISWLRDQLPNIPSSVAALELTLERKFQGGVIRHGTNGIQMVRLFRKGKARYAEAQMDERLIVAGESSRIPVTFYDDSLMPLTEWRQKQLGYAKREAVQALAGNFPDARKATYYRLPPYFRAVAYFCIRYFFRLGFLDGIAGWRWHFWQGLWYRWQCDLEIARLRLSSCMK